jgi:hypothetical protein
VLSVGGEVVGHEKCSNSLGFEDVEMKECMIFGSLQVSFEGEIIKMKEREKHHANFMAEAHNLSGKSDQMRA